jgi:pseudouridine kinase
VGGIVGDIIAKSDQATGSSTKSAIGSVQRAAGGVGRNIAEVVARAGGRPLLLSAVADDANGHALVSAAAALGIVRHPNPCKANARCLV